MAGNLVVSTINDGPIGAKNVIINGNFGINQRGVSGTVTLAAGAYGHDRWKAGASGCTYTFATSQNVTTLTISAGSLIQVIEGLNLNSGTYTLSWGGTAQGKIGSGSYAGSGVTGTAVGGTNLNVEFGIGTLSLVQLEAGSVTTPFERRPYGQELALCQRYYVQMDGPANYFANGHQNSTTQYDAQGVLPVVMRAAPTASLIGTVIIKVTVGGSTTVTNVTSFPASPRNFRVYGNNPAVGATGYGLFLFTSAAGSGATFSAEL